METQIETEQKTETMIRFGKFFSRPLPRLIALSRSKRLGTYGSGETTAPPGKRSFTTALTHALIRLLEKTPGGRFTTSKLLSETTDCEDFDIERYPSLVDWITRSGTGRIVLHPLPKDQIASLPSEEAKLGIQFTFRDMPSIDDMGTLGKRLNDLFAENELGITGFDLRGLKGSCTFSRFSIDLARIEPPRQQQI